MKLSKIYSPFFMLLLAALCFSCSRRQDSTDADVINKGTLRELKQQQNTADQYYQNEKYFAAYKQYMYLRERWLDAKNLDNLAYVSLQMAAILYKTGSYNEAETMTVAALHYLKKSGQLKNLPSTYNLLGVIYRKLYDYDNALLSYRQAAHYTKDSLDICILKNNIASVQIDKKEYQQALTSLLAINKSVTLATSQEMKARVLDNIGLAYFKIGDAKALQYLEKGLLIRKTIADQKGLISSYSNLYEFYKNNDNSKAKKYALALYETATKIENQEEQLKGLKALIERSNALEQEHYLSRFLSLNEQLNVKRIKDENKFAKIRYDYKSTQAKNLKLQAEQAESDLKVQRHSFIIWTLTVASITIVLFFIFIYKNQKLKHKKDTVIEVYKTESRISKKIHDELANDIFKAMSFAESNEITSDNQDKLLKELENIYGKTRDISHENKTIDTDINYEAVLKQMLADYMTPHTNVITSNFDSIKWSNITTDKKIAVYRVLHELMVNMKKHSGAALVLIKFSVENNRVLIQYTDNGKGMTEGQPLIKNGLQNAENRIFAIGGSLTFEPSANGFKVNCTFPI